MLTLARRPRTINRWKGVRVLRLQMQHMNKHEYAQVLGDTRRWWWNEEEDEEEDEEEKEMEEEEEERHAWNSLSSREIHLLVLPSSDLNLCSTFYILYTLIFF